jgi:glycine cleavage system transcriptional repressor
VTLHAVTVVGHDRPGIIAEVTGRLAALGGNLEDSTMTLLRGHFAMTLLVDADASPEAVEAALAPITADGSLLVSVRSVTDEPGAGQEGSGYVLSVHGADQPGIVSAITSVLARRGGNITDLTTRLTGALYVLVAEVDLPGGVDLAAVQADLREMSASLGVDASLRPADPDLL